MFTGLVTHIGRIAAIRPLAAGSDMRLAIAAPFDCAALAIGASVACAGCCLTVVATTEQAFEADVSAETLAKTTLGDLAVGAPINLERSLKLGDELGGHLVSGHVDGVAEVIEVTPEHGGARWRFRAPKMLGRFIAAKGSVALDGVSLTVNAVADDPAGMTEFAVNLIPHTAAVTTFGARRVGDRVNLEIDLLARYVARLTEAA